MVNTDQIKCLLRDLKMSVHRRSPFNLTEIEWICGKEWHKVPKSRCAKLIASKKTRGCNKGASTKYRVKGLNTYVNVIFQFFLFNKLAKMSKILFSLYHYGVYIYINILNDFSIRLQHNKK